MNGVAYGKMFCEGSLSQEDGLDKPDSNQHLNGITKTFKHQSRMRNSNDSLNSQESGVDAKSQTSKCLLEKMSEAIAKRENCDSKVTIDDLKVSG